MAAAAAAPAAAAPGAPPELIEMIDNGIKQILFNIKAKLGNGHAVVNQNVKKIIDSLEALDGFVAREIIDINTRTNNIHITRDPATGNYRQDLNAGNYGNVGEPNISNLIKLGKYELDPTDVNSAILEDATGKKIDIDSINATNTFDRTRAGSASEDANLIKPFYEPTDPTLNFNDPNPETRENNLNTLQSRLINCQYLEILYLVKHEELMKTFAFTLNLYEKYSYSIKIILFILKNILQPTGPLPPPHVTPHQGCPECPNIKLPKALIPNIKKLLKDQKTVQNVISQMEETFENDPSMNELKSIMNKTLPPDENIIKNRAPAGINDVDNPNRD